MNSSSPISELPLRTLKRSFDLLIAGPDSLTLPIRVVKSRKARVVAMPLSEARQTLLGYGVSARACRAAWTELVLRARREGPEWKLAACGMAYPALCRHATSLYAEYAGDEFDLQSELLTGFLAALAEVNLKDRSITDIAGYLGWRAYAAARTFLARENEASETLSLQEMVEKQGDAPDGAGAFPPVHSGGHTHPDQVLDAAVQAGVITDTEARFLSAIHIGGGNTGQAAAEVGWSRATAYRRRPAIEERLVDFLLP